MSAEPLARGYTRREVARRYRVSPGRVSTWIRTGQLEAVDTSTMRCGRPRWVITPEALARFEAGRRAAEPPKPPRRRRRQPAMADYYPD
jgi:transposase